MALASKKWVRGYVGKYELPQKPRRILAVGGGGGLNLLMFDFGYMITDAVDRKVRLNGGELRIGLSRFAVAGKEVQAMASPCYVYVTYMRGQLPTIETTNTINDTVPQGETYNHLLYTFEIDDDGGFLKLKRIHHLGGIFVGTYWG